MRDFNTAGPVRPEEHYCIPALDRIDLREVLALIRRRRYFILHAPRQTGKTSTLLALRDLLNGGSAGDYRCVYVNVEPGQSAREDVGQAMGAILDGLAKQLRRTLGDFETAALAESMDTSVRSHSVLGRVLTSWSENGAAPAVLLIDEIDSLVGDTLVSVLRQLRAGHSDRPGGFPQTAVLCGIRDVRDYRIREYALGSHRVDLLVVWPRSGGGTDRFVVECKLLRSGRARTLERGLDQTAAYMDLSGTDVGHLVIFDMREGRTWEERIFREEHVHAGKRITVWGA